LEDQRIASVGVVLNEKSTKGRSRGRNIRVKGGIAEVKQQLMISKREKDYW